LQLVHYLQGKTRRANIQKIVADYSIQHVIPPIQIYRYSQAAAGSRNVTQPFRSIAVNDQKHQRRKSDKLRQKESSEKGNVVLPRLENTL
jgi:hypothetical protein